MPERRRLSPLISLRRIADRVAIVDHASGSLHLLNAEGGDVLERLEAGATDFDEDELEFIDEMGELGVFSDGADRPDMCDGSDSSDFLDELNRFAADNLVPLHCQMELTYRCALRCRHCYLGGVGGDPREELAIAEIARILDELAELGCLFLFLTGGEPFLRRDLEEIVDAARDRRFAVSFATSGWGYAPARLERLAARGLDSAQVSLYGPDAASHDAFTGQTGSFDDALGCLRTLRDLGVRVRAAVTPSRLAADRIEEMRELLLRERIPAALGIYMSPRRDGDPMPQSLTVDEGGLARILGAFPPEAEPRMAGLRLDDRPCGAGADALSIDPYGTVHPCLQLRQAAGSVRELPLAEIWMRSEVLERIRRVTLADLVDCPSCALRSSCNRCAGFAVAEGSTILNHCSFDCLQAGAYKKRAGSRHD